METKTYIWIGIFIGSTLGGLLGTWLDHGNGLGIWTILLSTLGGIAGIWAGYTYSQS
ncbi:MAG: hypothetical protein KIH63_002055 [Candidatus Saccharibacteria bacterium]|nr:hypothetical protein [Candidatus Saccharibacteria bacterium]